MSASRLIVPVCVPIVGVAAGVAAWGAVHATSELFGPTLHRTRRPRSIGLTFDDGPNPSVTPELLGLLAKHRVRASFFLIGRFVRQYPGLVREIAAAGHAIGNHTDTHANLFWLSGRRIAGELVRCQQSITAALDGMAAPPNWMRPPYGYRGPQLPAAVQRAGLRGVAMWSLTCYDWNPQPSARLVKRLERVENSAEMRDSAKLNPANRRNGGGDIVLLHDGDYREPCADRRHVLRALEYWLPRWRDAGRDFVTIEEVADESWTGV